MEITWKAPEFEYRQKDISWYWASIFFAVLVLGIAIWQRNFLFMIFVVVAEILVLVWANQRPREVEFKLTDQNLEIVGGKVYPYSEIASFSIERETEGEWNPLTLHIAGTFKPAVRVLVPKAQTDLIEKTLGGAVREVEAKKSALDDLQKFIRF